jgi:hypothetical protein
MPSYDIFLSHNQRQKPWVRHLCAILRDAKLKVFFDEDSIKPGEYLLSAIDVGIRNSKLFLLVISPASLRSKWVGLEAILAMDDNPLSANLIPVVLENVDSCDVPSWIRCRKYVDLTDPQTRDERYKQLLLHLGVGIRKKYKGIPWPKTISREHDQKSAVVSIADVNDILNWGWDGKRLLDELISLDYKTMDGLTPEHEGQTEQWASVFMDHPDTWRLIINSNKDIVGYWHFVPLFDNYYDIAKTGNLLDSQITADKVKLFELPGSYNIYFVSICLLPQMRRTWAIRMLYLSILDVIETLSLDGVFIKEICTNAYTSSGIALCKNFGFSYIGEHVGHGKIFLKSFRELIDHDLFNNYPNLKKVYLNL